FVRDHKIRMAILSVPAAAAQEVANVLIECGITGILNFAPIVLHVPEEVMVNNVNLAIELENLSYFIQDYRINAPRGLLALARFFQHCRTASLTGFPSRVPMPRPDAD